MATQAAPKLRLSLSLHKNHSPESELDSPMSQSQLDQSPSQSSSDTPDATKPIYQGGTTSIKKSSKKYFDAVDTIPGQAEPFLLPHGADSCPIATCPRYGRTCNPHWRLNEHMKLRHGWPRKHTQPNTDHRLTGLNQSSRRFGKRKHRATTKRAKVSQSAASESDASKATARGESTDLTEVDSRDIEHDVAAAEVDVDVPAAETSSRPKRKLKPTEKRKSQMMDEFKPKVTTKSPASARIPSPRRTRISTGALSRLAIEDTDAMMLDIDDFVQNEASSSDSDNQSDGIDAVDGDMVVHISQLITSLRTEKGVARPGSLKLAQDYQKLLDDDKFRVNTVLSAEQAKNLMSMYRTLAQRHNAQQKILEPMQMSAAATQPLMLSMPNPLHHEQNQHSESVQMPKNAMPFHNIYSTHGNPNHHPPNTTTKKRASVSFTSHNERPVKKPRRKTPEAKEREEHEPEFLRPAAKTHHRNQIALPRPASLMTANGWNGVQSAVSSPVTSVPSGEKPKYKITLKLGKGA